MPHEHPSPRVRLEAAERRVRELESQLAPHAALVEAAAELADANDEMDRLMDRLEHGACSEPFPVRLETMDRLARAERNMRRVASELLPV